MTGPLALWLDVLSDLIVTAVAIMGAVWLWRNW